MPLIQTRGNDLLTECLMQLRPKNERNIRKRSDERRSCDYPPPAWLMSPLALHTAHIWFPFAQYEILLSQLIFIIKPQHARTVHASRQAHLNNSDQHHKRIGPGPLSPVRAADPHAETPPPVLITDKSYMFTKLLSISVMYTTIRPKRGTCQIRHRKIKQREGTTETPQLASLLLEHSARWQNLEAIRSKGPPVQHAVPRRHERKKGP